MSLDSYIRSFGGLMLEIEQSLSKSDIERATHGLRSSGEPTWQRWMLEHEKEIFEFLSATPSKRGKKKAWKDDDTRILLSLAALVYARRATRLARAAELFQRLVGLSYRDALAHGAEACADLLFEADTNWPFRGEDPWGNVHPLDFLDPESPWNPQNREQQDTPERRTPDTEGHA